MATYYVTQNGTGDGLGGDISNAMSLSSHNNGSFLPNDIIYLSGEFTGNISIPSSGSSSGYITYDGNDGVNTKMTRTMSHNGPTSETGISAVNKSYLIIQNMTIFDGWYGISITGDTFSNIRVYKCDIQQMLGIGLSIFGGDNEVHNAIQDVIIGGSVANGNYFWNIGAGTGSSDCSLVGIDNLVISHNTLGADIGTNTVDDRGVDGLVMFRDTNFIIEHNQLGPHWDLYEDDPTGGDHSAFKGDGEDGIDLKNLCYDGIIRYNRFPQNRQSGITVQMGTYNVEIHSNYFEDNMWGGLWCVTGAAGTGPMPAEYPSDNIKAHHNIFYRNRGYGMYFESTFVDIVTGLEVWNNVFVENTLHDIYDVGDPNTYRCGLAIVAGLDTKVYNNIFYNNTPNELDYRLEVGLSYNATGELDYNLYYTLDATSGLPIMSNARYGPSRDITPIDSLPPETDYLANPEANGLITVDPLFIDTAFNNDSDFMLQELSTAVGAGDVIPTTLRRTYDAEEAASPYDMGAYNKATEAPKIVNGFTDIQEGLADLSKLQMQAQEMYMHIAVQLPSEPV